MAITFRTAHSANANTVAITTPAAKDLIVVFAFDNAAATVPTVPAGYVSKASNTTTLCGGVCATRISDGTETSVPAFTNATQIVAIIYRGAFDVGAVASGVGNSATVTYPALTLKIADGTSWVTAGAIDKGWSAGSNGTTAALTSNRTNQTTCNGLDTTGGVASFVAQNLTGTGSGRFVAFSAELIAQPLISETLTQNEGGKVQIRGGAFDYNLIDSVGTDTVATGTSNDRDQLSMVDMLRFVDPNKAAFVREVDLLTQSDTTVAALGILALAADQLTQADAMLFKLLGGSFVYQLLDASGKNSVDGDTTDQDQLAQVDPTFTETLDLSLTLVCPELSGLWNDYGAVDFVLTPSQVDRGDFTPWSLNALPGNIIPFENFEFILAPSLINMIERGLVGLLTDSYTQVLGTAGQLFEILSDTMTLSDALAIGYGQGQVDALSFSDSSSLGFGDLISDALSLSDSEAALLGMLSTFSDQLVLSDSEIIGYGNATVDQLTFSDTNSIGYGDIISETLVLSDSLIVGYGNAEVDSLTFSDNTTVGYGLLIADSINNWLDAVQSPVVPTIPIIIFDVMQVVDALLNSGIGAFGTTVYIGDYVFINSQSIQGVIQGGLFPMFPVAGYGAAGIFGFYSQYWKDSLRYSLDGNIGLRLDDAIQVYFLGNLNARVTVGGTGGQYFASAQGLISMLETAVETNSIAETLSDTLTLSDSDAIGYGQGQVDSLTFSDSNSIGYGDLISDALSLSDSEVNQLSIAEVFSDTLSLSDAIAAGYGNAVNDQLALSDSSSLLFGVNSTFSETLTISDSNSLGYGFLIADSFTLTDSLTSLFSIAETLSDTLTMSDSEIIGYGNATVDSLTFLDSSSVGYGDVISDTMTLSDSETNVLGLNELTTDQLVLIDSETIGYGNALVEQLVFVDSNSVGYGDLIAEQLVLSDSAAFLFTMSASFSETLTLADSSSLGYGFLIADQLVLTDTFAEVLSIAEMFSDTLVFSDSVAAGYGNVVSDQLSMSDSEVIGYGQGTVDSLTFSDTSAVGYGDLISDSFTLTDSFAFNSGASLITESLSDTLTLSDFLAIGYGQNNVDSLTFTDSSSLGFGDLISDTFTLTDSEVNVLGMLEAFSDQLVLSDSLAELLAGALVLSDTLTLTDSETIGYGNQITEQLIFLEANTVGYGDLIADSLNNWLDQFQFSTGQPSISLQFSEQLSLSEALGAGYGNQMNEQNVMSDVMQMLESFEVLLNDATPQMLEALQMLMTQAMQSADSIAFLNDTYSAIGSYLAGLSDAFTISDQFNESLLATLSLLLADDEGAQWLDAVLAEFIFAPGASRIAALRIILEVVAEIRTSKVVTLQ